jgi:hypothetical protein
MTEAEWWSLTEPGTRLSHFPRPVSRRKDRLFAVGCCYHIWGLLHDKRSRKAVRVAERFAEGEATVEELEIAHEAAGEAAGDAEEPQERDAAHAAEAASDPSENLGILTSDYAMDAAGHLVRQAQHSLLLELLGPPFCLIDINPAWLTWNYGTVQKIAQAIYDERAFDRMPILADALEEAGCTSQDILTHCRQPGEHVRGCWVVDLILGRP